MMGEGARRSSSTAAVASTSKRAAKTHMLTPATRPTATVAVYETECIPPPDLSALDQYREDGRPCIKDYTNPAFFVEEWIAEQKRQAQEARRRREKSRKNKQSDERGIRAPRQRGGRGQEAQENPLQPVGREDYRR